MRLIRTAALGLVTVMFLAACGSASPSDSAGGQASYDFAGTDLVGEFFEGTELKGTPTVLWFWAPWCPTCRAQAPTVTSLAKKYGGTVNFVGVGGAAKAEEIRDYANDELTSMTVLVDEQSDVWRHFRITEQSSYVVIDGSGSIVAEGYLDNNELEDTVADIAS